MNKLLVSLLLVVGLSACANEGYKKLPVRAADGTVNCNMAGMYAAQDAMTNLKRVSQRVNEGKAHPKYLSNVQNSVNDWTTKICQSNSGYRIEDVIAYANHNADLLADSSVSSMELWLNPNIAS